jgi:hypothetical protein
MCVITSACRAKLGAHVKTNRASRNVRSVKSAVSAGFLFPRPAPICPPSGFGICEMNAPRPVLNGTAPWCSSCYALT